MKDIAARELKGHNILAVERFWDSTCWMIEFTVLRPTAYGEPGDEMRLFLTEDGYQSALQSQQRREIKIKRYGYLCDIEQSRRPAPNGDFVERISAFLNLDKSEHELLLDLAAKSRNTVSADLPDYIMEKDIVRAALRVAKEVDATDEEWQTFMKMLKERKR